MRFYHEGNPIAKQRHRMSNGFAYDPQSKEKMAMKFDFANQLRQQRRLNALQGAVLAQVDISYPIPKSWSKKRQKSCLGNFVTTKPDNDNFEKWYYDVLSGIAYKDDAQIAVNFTQKRYSTTPGVNIYMLSLEEKMINEHAVTYKDKLTLEDIDYIVKKANRLGLVNRQIVRVYQEEDGDGTHIYFSADGMKDKE